MSNSSTSTAGQYYSGKLNRNCLLSMLDAARAARSFRFGRQTAMIWLANFPGDLRVQVELGKTFVEERKFNLARPIFEAVYSHDPEYVDAIKGLEMVDDQLGLERVNEDRAVLFSLGFSQDPNVPEWAQKLRQARLLVEQKEYSSAEEKIRDLLVEYSNSIQVALLHLWINYCEHDMEAAYTLASVYRDRWQDCVQFNLIKAEALFAAGQDQEAVTLLHRCAAQDVGGQVTQRWWGDYHPYQPLWQTNPEIFFDLPIPAEIAGQFGWNLLNTGIIPVDQKKKTVDEDGSQTCSSRSTGCQNSYQQSERKRKPASPVVNEVEKELDSIAARMKQPSVTRTDGRFPIYVLLSNRAGLIARFGEESFKVLDQGLNGLASTIRKRKGWGAMVHYVDEHQSISCEKDLPKDCQDPWKIKLALVDLDDELAKKGARIGAVLIVGDDGIIPYHRLPNPIDDVDDEVLSDNPYATLDNNYFIPEWMVGRLPGEDGDDPSLLIEGIRRIEAYHLARIGKAKKSKPGFSWMKIDWSNLFGNWFRSTPGKNFGYSASVWKRPSHAVFRPIGDGKNLRQSPPMDAGKLKAKELIDSPLGYYNLHGVADAGEWYGQKDFLDRGTGPDYPIALRPSDLKNNGNHPSIVFSEACYGGLVDGKKETNSIALRFLALGTHAMVGSTCTSYGSICLPLVGADLLANYFWRHIREGYTSGEALMMAKISLAREMTKRQGYLDGEDQKTLLSFNLFGDPLAAWNDGSLNSKGVVRSRIHPGVKTICDHSMRQVETEEQEKLAVPPRIVNDVKSLVEPYLPGLQQAEMDILQSGNSGCNHQDEPCKGCAIHGRKPKSTASKRTLIIFKKEVEIEKHSMIAYARITLDESGKIVKSVVSR